MKLPNIKQHQNESAASSLETGDKPNAILPLVVQFERDADEQVAVMFETTRLIMNGGRSPMSLMTKILIFVVIFLVALIAFQMMDRFGTENMIFGYVAVGAGAALLLAGLWGMIYQGRMMASFQGRLRSGTTCTVEISEEGVRSSSKPVIVASDWKNVTDITIANNCLLFIDEVWVHYIPFRALPAGVSPSALQEECKRRKQFSDGEPS